MTHVLAFFGADLVRRNARAFLQWAHKRGRELLALDSHAMAHAARAGLPCTTLEDWLEPEVIARAVENSILCSDKWFEPAREHFTVEGVCLPEVDKSSMKWFWTDALLALELARSLQSRNCSLSFFRNLLPRASVGHPRSDACNTLWGKEACSKSVHIRLDQILPDISFTSVRGGLSRVTEALFTRGKSERRRLEKAIPPNSIVFVIGPEEEVRFSHLVDQFSRSFPGRVGAVFAGAPSDSAIAVISNLGVPVLQGPKWPVYRWLSALPSWLLPSPNRDLSRKFLAGYRLALEAADGTVWQLPMQHLGFHFRYYCVYRWPHLLTESLVYWRNLWSRIRPAGVLVTSRDEAVFALATITAKEAGALTFCIPHGGNSGFKRDSTPLPHDWVLCNSPLQQSRFELRTVHPARTVVCKGLLPANEYQVSPLQKQESLPRWRILALTEATGEGVNLVTYTSPKAHVRALRIVASVPEDLADKTEVWIKTHPHISDKEIIEAAGSEVVRLLLPLKSDLHTALERADLVVGVNYRGTALIHAMKAEKPVIQLLTEWPALERRADFPYHILEEGTTVARTPEEFWNLVRSFFTQPDAAHQMREKSKRFFAEQLDDSRFPGVVRLVDEKLGKRPASLLVEN